MPTRPKHALHPAMACLVALLLGGGAFFLARQTASPAPLGVPLPIPHERFITKGVKINECDFLKGRIAPVYLEFLAPEPDGTIPLRYPYDSGRGGFSIKHPEGALLMEEPGEYFAKTQLDAECNLNYDQPLKQIKYML